MKKSKILVKLLCIKKKITYLEIKWFPCKLFKLLMKIFPNEIVPVANEIVLQNLLSYRA